MQNYDSCVTNWLQRPTVRTGRRIAVAVVGTTVVLGGIALLALPGPGLVTIVAGLGILSAEFHFARRWFTYLKAKSAKAADGAGIPRRWRWTFPALAGIVTVAALAAPLFVCLVRTESGWRFYHRPSISYRRTVTSVESLRKAAAEGDSGAAEQLRVIETVKAAAP